MTAEAKPAVLSRRIDEVTQDQVRLALVACEDLQGLEHYCATEGLTHLAHAFDLARGWLSTLAREVQRLRREGATPDETWRPSEALDFPQMDEVEKMRATIREQAKLLGLQVVEPDPEPKEEAE